MNKLVAAICMLVTSLLAFALVIIMIAGISGHKIFNWGLDNVRVFSGGESTLLKEESLVLTDYRELSLDSTSSGVYIRSTNSDKLTVRQYGHPDRDKNDIFNLNKQGDSASIELRNRGFSIHIFSWAREYIEIEVPVSWHGNVSLTTSSGGLKIEDSFEWNNINLKCSSGGVDVEGQLTGNEVNISASSGGINLRDRIKAENLDISVSSGGVKTDYMEAVTYNIESSSGGMKIGELNGEGNIKCSSGGIKIDMLTPTGNVDIRTTSGGIVVNVPRDLEHHVTTRATSGGVKINEV